MLITSRTPSPIMARAFKAQQPQQPTPPPQETFEQKLDAAIAKALPQVQEAIKPVTDQTKDLDLTLRQNQAISEQLAGFASGVHDSELSWQCVLASHGKVLDYLDRDFADSLWSRLVALAQGDDPELARQALSYLGNNGDEGKRKQQLALLLAEPLPSYKDVLSYFHFYRYSPALPAMISLLQKGIPERSELCDALESQTGMGLGLDPQARKDGRQF